MWLIIKFLVDLNNCKEIYDGTIPLTLEDEEESKNEQTIISHTVELQSSSNENTLLGKQSYSQHFKTSEI